jgi:flavin-dependent dehydrogenase
MSAVASPSPDVVVIGGGPAGSTVSTLLAQHGRRVQLFERETFPRFHIGESLIPETYWVLKRLNMLDKMKASHFVQKRSVQFVSANGKLSAPFYFWDNKPHECSQTWQVERGEFDQMLLENARAHGVDAREGVHVLDVLFEGERAVGVRIQEPDGTRREVRAPVVVDASGQAAMLMNRHGLRIWDPLLNKGAIWTYYEGAAKDDNRDDGATLVVQTPDKRGWWWNIPLHGDRLSCGIVRPFEDIFKNRGGLEQTYLEEIEQTPYIEHRVANAKRITGYFATRDYTYRSRELAGDGWVMVGDAFGFLDPLYSSGVMLALKTGEFAADAIHAALDKGDTSKAALGAFAPVLNAGIDRMRRLVCEYYNGFNFGTFIRHHPELRGAITDLLIGDLFTEAADRVWAPMDALAGAAKIEIAPWHAGPGASAVPAKANVLMKPEGVH